MSYELDGIDFENPTDEDVTYVKGLIETTTGDLQEHATAAAAYADSVEGDVQSGDWSEVDFHLTELEGFVSDVRGLLRHHGELSEALTDLEHELSDRAQAVA